MHVVLVLTSFPTNQEVDGFDSRLCHTLFSRESFFHGTLILDVCMFRCLISMFFLLSSNEVPALCWSQVGGCPVVASIFLYKVQKNVFPYRAVAYKSLAIIEVKLRRKKRKKGVYISIQNCLLVTFSYMFVCCDNIIVCLELELIYLYFPPSFHLTVVVSVM